MSPQTGSTDSCCVIANPRAPIALLPAHHVNPFYIPLHFGYWDETEAHRAKAAFLEKTALGKERRKRVFFGER